MSLDNYHQSFLKSLYGAESGTNQVFDSSSSPGDTNSVEDFGGLTAFDTSIESNGSVFGQIGSPKDNMERSTVARPNSFGSSLFSDFSNPLGAPGTPIGSQMSVGTNNLYSSQSQQHTPVATTPSSGNVPPPKNPKLYKTELCRSWMDHGKCNYGERCQYAHGELEKRPVPRHPKYKTEACQSFHQTGYCPYGPRCHFIHNENPTPIPPGLSPYASQYHNTNMTKTTSGSGVASVTGGYGSAGESPAGSSNDSGSESPNGSFSPGLELDENGPFSSGFLSSTPNKSKRGQQICFDSFESAKNPINDNQFSYLLNDLCKWNISEPQLGLNSTKWDSDEATISSPKPVSRLPVFAQLSNPQ